MLHISNYAFLFGCYLAILKGHGRINHHSEEPATSADMVSLLLDFGVKKFRLTENQSYL